MWGLRFVKLWFSNSKITDTELFIIYMENKIRGQEICIHLWTSGKMPYSKKVKKVIRFL